jgi:hypothetical protein
MEPFIRWEFKPPNRHPNGVAKVALRLLASDGSELKESSWSYMFLPLASFRELGPPTEPIFLAGEFGDSSLTLDIEAGTFVLVEAFARALVHGNPAFAQTSILLYGEGLNDKLPVSNSGPPTWPSFDFRGSGEIYWPQSGHTFTLTARGGTQLVGPLLALGEKGPALGEAVFLENGLSFTPGHDPDLNSGGSLATKPLYFVGYTSQGPLSYTIYIHRPRYGGLRLSWGIGLFCVSLGLSTVGIHGIFKKKRGRRHAGKTN